MLDRTSKAFHILIAAFRQIPISNLSIVGRRARILFQLLIFLSKFGIFCLFKLLGVGVLGSDELATSKFSFRILIISFADFGSDILSPSYKFNVIKQLYWNFLSSRVLSVKSEVTPSYTTLPVTNFQHQVAVLWCVILSVPVPMWQWSVVWYCQYQCGSAL